MFEPFHPLMEHMNKDSRYSDERQLMSQVAAGDREAFRYIYDQTYGKVFHYVRGFAKNETIAEDVIVQTYAVVWQKGANFKGTSRLTTWIIGIARNIAFKEFKKTKHEAPFDETYCSADIESHKEPEIKDRNKKIQTAIDKLSPNQKEILELVFYQDLTYPEVSEILNIPVNTVKTRVFYAKKALKDELTKLNILQNDL